MQICTIDLVLGDCDARDVDLKESDSSDFLSRDDTHIGPSCILTRWLADTTASVQASHTWLDSHGHELVVIMSRQGLSKRLFVIQERSKVELLVPCKLKVQRGQLVVAVGGSTLNATLYCVWKGLLVSNLGIVLLPLYTFCLEHFDVCR
jgi:hypothetical protein